MNDLPADHLAALLERVAAQDADAAALQWQRHGLAEDVAAAGFDLAVLLAVVRLHALSARQLEELRFTLDVLRRRALPSHPCPEEFRL